MKLETAAQEYEAWGERLRVNKVFSRDLAARRMAIMARWRRYGTRRGEGQARAN